MSNSIGPVGSNKLFTNQYLFRLIWPLVLETALTITVGMADTMMVSSLGEAAVSGVSLVDMVNQLIISVMTALATGGAVVVSQYLGARREDQACQAANQLLITVLTAGLFIMTFALFLHGPILRLLFGRIDADVMANASSYFLISAFSYPFLAMYEGNAALFRSMGNSRVTLMSSLVMNIINIGGNAIGVFILHMGVAGVAVPSLLSRAVACLMLGMLLRDQKRQVHFVRERLRVHMKTIRRILYIGIPNGVENGVFELGRVLVIAIVAVFGTSQIAANGVANNLDAVSIMLAKAMNVAMITVIGQCVGAGDVGQVRYYLKKLMKITYLANGLWDVLLLMTLPFLLSLYGLTEETRQLAWILVVIHTGFAMALWPMSFTFPNFLRAANDVRYTMVVSIASMFTFRIIFSYLLGVGLGMGIIGVWIAMLIDWGVRVTMFGLRYLHGDWMRTMRH